MPIWLSILITLAVKFGLPWLLSKFPGLPASVREVIEELIKKLRDHAEYNKGMVPKAEYKAVKKALVKEAKAKIATCYGDRCKV